MEHPENIFQAARVPPPVSKQRPAKPTYDRASAGDYPSMRFHETMGTKIVHNADEDFAATEAGWVNTPIPEAPPEPPAPSGRENVAAWKAMADRLTAENERLTEDNMRLKSQVEDSKDAALVADLREKLTISERARKSLQQTVDHREAAATREKAKAKPAEESEENLLDLIKAQSGAATEE